MASICGAAVLVVDSVENLDKVKLVHRTLPSLQAIIVFETHEDGEGAILFTDTAGDRTAEQRGPTRRVLGEGRGLSTDRARFIAQIEWLWGFSARAGVLQHVLGSSARNSPRGGVSQHTFY